MTKADYVSHILRERGLKLCAAESFTGGNIASKLVALPGASDIFAASLVCYAEDAKCKLLGVSTQTLASFGAVSSETVSEMLDGLGSLSLADVCVATSGNAGPTSEKAGEVGVVFIGVSYGGKKLIKRYHIGGDRTKVIRSGAQKALELVAEILKQ